MDLRDAATPYLTADELDIKLFQRTMGDYSFKLSNMIHRQRLELYRETTELLELKGTALDHMFYPHTYAVGFPSNKAETHFWATVAGQPCNSEVKPVVEMLSALQRQPGRKPRLAYISCVVANPLGWFFFDYMFKPAGLLALFCARWGTSMPGTCGCCSGQYQVFVTGTRERTAAPFVQCVAFEPPPGHPDISNGLCTNCMSRLPIQGSRTCSWKSFPQARKRHEREGPDSIAFAGHAYKEANRTADHYTIPTVNPKDAPSVRRIPFPNITIRPDGQVVGLPECVTIEDIS